MRVEAPAICGAIYLSSCFFIWMSLQPVNVKDLPGLLRNPGPDALNWSELAELHGSYFSGHKRSVPATCTAPLLIPCPSSLSATVPWCCHSIPSPGHAVLVSPITARTQCDPSLVLPSQVCLPVSVLTWPDGKNSCSSISLVAEQRRRSLALQLMVSQCGC